MCFKTIAGAAFILSIVTGLSATESAETNSSNEQISTRNGETDLTSLSRSHPHTHLHPHPHIDKWNETNCGIRNVDGVNGSDVRNSALKHNETQFGEFPWMVALYRQDNTSDTNNNNAVYICGGTVVAPNVVLTAAHCVNGLEPNVLVARAGVWDLLSQQDSLPYQDARIKEIVIHEHYNSDFFYNDLALLMLETSYQWAANVRPICLPPPGLSYDDARCFVTGWRQEIEDHKQDGNQRRLMKLEVPVVARRVCQAKLRHARSAATFRLHDSFMCAGGETNEQTCLNDGGAPLVCPDPWNAKRFFQAGLVSWGMSCTHAELPGVYTYVKQLRDWMNGQLWRRGVDFIHFTA